ncbi:MAG: hypothetical protein ACK5XN_22455 [Bacteroidota bacterium]|jgi:multidrug transporter EmrE-like cation transporter
MRDPAPIQLPQRHMWTLIGLTGINIAVQLINAAIIKESTALTSAEWVWLLVVYVVVLAFNGVRFVVWGIIHKRYPIGVAYASTALLFPAIVTMSYLYGEPVTVKHLIGVALVMIGVVSLVRQV